MARRSKRTPSRKRRGVRSSTKRTTVRSTKRITGKRSSRSRFPSADEVTRGAKQIDDAYKAGEQFADATWPIVKIFFGYY